jgi:two-component system, sensor histidine kinase and response regulator
LQEAPVCISELKLKKIVEELVSNACKFSVPGQPVRVVSFSNQDAYTLFVIDQGRGMASDQIANLGAYMQFERKIYEQQGSGLGLVIAKRLVELHNGQLAIESLPGKQTTVRVTLPLQ